MHDPLNDVENIAQAADAVRESGGRLYAGLAFSGYMPNLPRVVEKARRLAEVGADHLLLHDPAGALDPGTCDKVIAELREAAGIPVGLYCQGTGGNALAMAIESARDGAEPIATAVYPVAWTLHRVSSEVLCDALSGLGLEHGVDQDRLWEASRFIDEHVTSQLPALPDPAPDHASHRAAPAAGGHGLRPGRAAADAGRGRPAGRGAGRVPAGATGLRDAAAGPADRRDPGRPGRHPRALRPPLGDRLRRDAGVPLGRLRQPAAGSGAGGGGTCRRGRRAAGARPGGAAPTRPTPPARRTSCWWRCSARTPNRLLAAIRARGRDERPEGADGLDRSEASRIRDLIDLVETSDVGELSIEDQGVKITVRRQEERASAPRRCRCRSRTARSAAARPSRS